MTSPKPAEIRAALERAGHTQQQAGDLIGVARRTVQDWVNGVTDMPPGMWELYRHKAGLARIPFRRAKNNSEVYTSRSQRDKLLTTGR